VPCNFLTGKWYKNGGIHSDRILGFMNLFLIRVSWRWITVMGLFLSISNSFAWTKRVPNQAYEESVAIDITQPNDLFVAQALPFQTKLEETVFKNDVGNAAKLIKAGADYKKPGLVAMAVCHQYWKMVNYLLKSEEDEDSESNSLKLKGIDLNGTYAWEGHNFSALEWALHRNHSYTAIKLINKGAFYDRKEILKMARLYGCRPVIYFLNKVYKKDAKPRLEDLLLKDIDPDAVYEWNGQIFSALEWLIYQRKPRLAAMLIKYEVEFDRDAILAMALRYECWSVISLIVTKDDRLDLYKCPNDEAIRTLTQWVRFHWAKLIAGDSPNKEAQMWSLKKLAKLIKAF
jgi:hypothetical protein